MGGKGAGKKGAANAAGDGGAANAAGDGGAANAAAQPAAAAGAVVQAPQLDWGVNEGHGNAPVDGLLLGPISDWMAKVPGLGQNLLLDTSDAGKSLLMLALATILSGVNMHGVEALPMREYRVCRIARDGNGGWRQEDSCWAPNSHWCQVPLKPLHCLIAGSTQLLSHG